MRYRTIEGGYKVPVFTREWKAMWFVLGMFFQIFAIFFAVICYAIRFPHIKTVRNVAAKWASYGTCVSVALIICGYYLISWLG